MPAKGGTHTPEAREKIRQARLKYFEENPEARNRLAQARIEEARRRTESEEVVTHKRCSKCRANKPLSEYTMRKEKLASGATSIRPEPSCRQCKAQACKDYLDSLRDSGIDPNRLQRERYARRSEETRTRYREKAREAAAARRRASGAKPRKRPAKGEGKNAGWPVAPLAGLLRREVDDRSLASVAAATGLDERRITGLLRQEFDTVTLATVDKILTGLGCPEELHFLYPEDDSPTVGYHYLEAAA